MLETPLELLQKALGSLGCGRVIEQNHDVKVLFGFARRVV